MIDLKFDTSRWGRPVSTGQLGFGIASRRRERYSAAFTNANNNNAFALAA